MSSPTAFTERERSLSINPPPLRRSFTVPAKISERPSSSPASSDSANGIETLFTHTSTKIVSFTASSPSTPSAAARQAGGDAATAIADSIPWKSATERTLAVGVLQIYRVTSSNVSFLNSGNLLHTIFPKSQCWCVEEYIFVLRIRQDSYYRIELPHDSEQDREKVEDFKSVLTQVLRYEKTPCPFTRGFEVELPDLPITPPPPPRRAKDPPLKAKKWLFDKTWLPEKGPRLSKPALEGISAGTTSSYEEDDRSSVNMAPEALGDSPMTDLEVTPRKMLRTSQSPSVIERARQFQGFRSATAPSTFRIVGSSSMQPTISEETEGLEAQEKHRRSPETMSLISSPDSFHSLESSGQATPSPPYLDAEAELFNPWADLSQKQKEDELEELSRGRGRHRRQVSEVTICAQPEERPQTITFRTPEARDTTPASPVTPTLEVHPSSAPSTPPLVSDSEDDSLEPPFIEIRTPPNTFRMRRLTGATQRRAFSPMPHPQNLIIPPKSRKHFTTALVRKTYELLLGPPAHLVTLMLKIAATISNGVWGFNTYRVRNKEDKIPCAWESSDDDDWTEDDYGIPLGNLEGSTISRRGWSADLD
ncbi:hypothetical protein P154DRAFT_522459 [Amniculicola lignicola CBS 123094]|uniref:Inheritance of peroxisomes protein 1 n=1 Tax=Amniculicola lignicola CBS 123094 TaxID=1392246 RepID=A0A6A5WHM9_9PLEO|nr:hypothetical protein P154DRAFT_522459 [Amniculicola lignicola CBS 123094]